MIVDLRPLTVYADDEIIGKNCRKRLKGKTTMSLLPDFYLLDINGLPDTEMAALRYASRVKVVGEDDSIVCTGIVEDIYVHYSDTNEITTVSISDGTSLWDQACNVSIAKGAGVQTTMQTILGSIPIASFMANDTRFLRGQALVGKTAEIISALARSIGARAFFTQSQVHVVSNGKTSSILQLTEEEVISETALATGIYAVKTKVKGYPVGLLTTLANDERQLRLVSQSIDADSWEGVWTSELLMVDEATFGTDGMEGG